MRKFDRERLEQRQRSILFRFRKTQLTFGHEHRTYAQQWRVFAPVRSRDELKRSCVDFARRPRGVEQPDNMVVAHQYLLYGGQHRIDYTIEIQIEIRQGGAGLTRDVRSAQLRERARVQQLAGGVD